MRKLNIDDTFLISEILDKMEFEINVKKGEENKIGTALLSLFVRKMYKAKKEIKTLIANVSGKDIDTMNIKEIGQTIKDILASEGFINFLK